jgi:autotransporter-associated beta strand protein
MELGFGISGANFTRDIVLNGGTMTSVSTANTVNSNVQLTAPSTISSSIALNLAGNLTESGGAHTLTKTGSAFLNVAGTASTRTGETIIDNGTIRVDANNALGSGKITIGQTTLGATDHSLRLNGVTIDNDVDSKYTWTGDYKGAITAINGTTSTINGDVTFLPLLAGASSRGGDLASDATAGSVLRLMGELNVGGGRTGIGQRDGVVEYGGGASTSYNLSVTNTARLVANNGIGSGVTVVLGGSGNATLDLNGFSASVESVIRNASTTWVENNGTSDSTLTVTPTADRSYSGGIRDGATNKVSLVKEGAFTYTLSSVNSYTGTTTVNGGKLLLTASHATATGDITVNSGGTLGGNSTVGGAIIVKSGGSLAPGADNVGSITTNGAVTLEAGGTFAAEIDSSAVSADLLFANAAVTLTGATLNVSDVAGSPAAITAGTKLTLIDYGPNTLTGTFDGLAEGATVTSGINTFTISYVDADKVTLTSTMVSSPYDSWATLKGLDGSPGKDPAFDADPDGDGYDNGLEWILGGDPLSGADGPLVQATATAVGGLTLSFNREEDSIGQATLTVEFDTDLVGPWTPFTTVGATSSGPVSIDTVPDPDAVSVNIPASNAVGGKLFGRLKATKP